MNSEKSATYEDELDGAIRALSDGSMDIAVDRAESARRLAPLASEPLFVLGLSALSLNDIGSAIRLMDEAHRLDPDGREIVEALAALHGRAGNVTDSLYFTKLAITLEENPRLSRVLPGGFSDFIGNIEKARQSAYLIDAGYEYYIRRYEKAAELCRRELKLRPQNVDAHQLLGRSLLGFGKYEEASQSLEQACRLAPRDAIGFVHWTEALLQLGRLEDAQRSAREAVRLDPASWPARGQLLTTLAYLPASDWQHYSADAAAAAAAIAPASPPVPPLPAVDPKTVDLTRRSKLRVGLLVNETAMRRDIGFFESVIAYHDPKKVYVNVYQQYAHPFGETPRLQKYAEDWRPVYNVDDETLSCIVANDAVDVLVDLCGSSPDARPAFLARRPAPVQVGWLGWPQSGLAGTVDLILSDPSVAEIDERDSGGVPLHVLSCGLLAYMGASVDIEDDTAKKKGPAERNGFVTFGGVLDPARVAGSAEIWARVLRAVPGARLLLGRVPASDEGTRARLDELFGRLGVGAQVEFQKPGGRQSPAAAFYSSIDILLDTHPFNGATELCEALWRGVPAITIRGDRRAGRVGSVILRLAGRESWIAEDAEAMASVARRLASDPAALARLRRTLPGDFKQSRLCDAKGFADEFFAQLETFVARARSG